METKHTSGNWHVGTTHGGELAVFANNEQNTQICTIEPLVNEKETESNAKLLAAAPEIFSALCNWLNSNMTMVNGMEIFDAKNKRERELMVRAYNAIKKTTE